jgi:copper transport outer membrane protein MctB
MFDFRYHVVSLAAVFLALVVGIVVGVGLSGQGIVQDSERKNLNNRIADLTNQLKTKDSELEQREAAERFVDASYPAVMEGRLAGKRVAVVYVGGADRTRGAIEQTITDAGGTLVRLRVLKVPVDDATLAKTIDGNTDLAALSSDDPGDVGRVLGRELVAGGETPLWDGVANQLVIERNPDASAPADAVVVVRTADPQQGATARFLGGLYAGLTSGSIPAVWVDPRNSADEPTAHPSGFAALSGVDTALGRVTLATLLETGDQGEYGPGTDTPVPAIEPVPAATTTSG